MITGSGAAANILVGLIFIPLAGIMGGAAAVLLSYVIMTIFIFIVTQKYYPIEYEMSKIAVILLTDVLALILFFLMWKDLIPSGIIIKSVLALIFLALLTYVSDIWKAKKIFTQWSFFNS
jgi:O-antigen/teichoic acid export membrane protein